MKDQRQRIIFLAILLTLISILAVKAQIDVTGGNSVAIGTNIDQGFKVNVINSMKTNTLRLESIYSSSNELSSQFGIWNLMDNSGLGHKYGQQTIVYQNDDGFQKLHRGMSVAMYFNGESNAGHYNAGVTSVVNTSSTSSGTIHGMVSLMKGTGNVRRWGALLKIDDDGSGERRGLFVETRQGTDAALTRGIDNQTFLYGATSTGSATQHVGFHNRVKLSNMSSGHKVGIYNFLENNGNTGERSGIINITHRYATNLDRVRGIDNTTYLRGTAGNGAGFYNRTDTWANSSPLEPEDGSFGMYNVLNLKGQDHQAYALYSTVTGSSQAGGTNPTVAYAGYFKGRFVVQGQLDLPSDESLKENIRDLTNATDVVADLRPVKYVIKKDIVKEDQFGFIAQEVETVIPELVSTVRQPGDGDEEARYLKAVGYIELIPILTKALQEQQAEIELLKQRIIELEN